MAKRSKILPLGLTCKQVPEVVRFNGLLVAAPAGFSVFDLVGGDDAVLVAAWRRLPGHLDTLKAKANGEKLFMFGFNFRLPSGMCFITAIA